MTRPWYTDARMLAAGNARGLTNGEPMTMPNSPRGPRSAPPSPDPAWLRVDAEVIEIRDRVGALPLLSRNGPTRIARITETDIVTDELRYYCRREHFLRSGGRHCGVTLYPVHHPRVIALYQQQLLRSVAQRATNLADLRYVEPVAVEQALTEIERLARSMASAAVTLRREATEQRTRELGQHG